jgi:hypothetical protein
MNRTIAALALATLAPAAVLAQTQVQTAASITSAVIEACYVKSSGSLYRINAPGAPAKCSTNGTPVSWNVQGPQGPQGPAGPAGLTGYRTVTETKHVAPQTKDYLVVFCAWGEVILGGGYTTSDPNSGSGDNWFKNVVVPTSTAIPALPDLAAGWIAQVFNTDPSKELVLDVTAICAKTSN